MKPAFIFLFACSLFSASRTFAQEEQPAPAAPQVRPAVPAKMAAPAPDAIKGNAAKDVSIVSATGSCSGSMKPIGIVNNAANGKSVIVKIELTANYSGHVSKKSSIIDNIAPNETRFIGCTGCIDNPSGKTCSTYKIIAAAYK